MPRMNEDEFIAFPKEMFVGAVRSDVRLEQVTQALLAIGVADDQIGFLQGEKGLEILNPEGAHGTVKERMLRKAEGFAAEGRILERSADHLRAGRTIVGVVHVDHALAERIMGICDEAGLEDCHYFGRWKID